MKKRRIEKRGKTERRKKGSKKDIRRDTVENEERNRTERSKEE